MLEHRKIEGRRIVSFRVARNHAEEAARRMPLAAPLTSDSSDPVSLWIGPEHWLLMSDSTDAGEIISECRSRMEGLTFNAVDCTDAFEVIRFEGESVRDLLSSGCGLDFRRKAFLAGSCQRTRFARIEATVIALDGSRFELVFDRTYGRYLRSWIADEEAMLQAVS